MLNGIALAVVAIAVGEVTNKHEKNKMENETGSDGIWIWALCVAV